MGSHLRLAIASGGSDAGTRAWSAVKHAFAAVELALSRFDPGSSLSALNGSAGSGRWVRVPATLRSALVLADRARRLTDGAFDARIIHALESAGERAGVALPSHAAATDDRWLHVARTDKVRLSAPGDLGGLGKGLALRLAARRLRDHGITDFLLDAGGDLLPSGRPPDGNSWRIGIEDPDAPAFPVVGLEVGSVAVATSSVAVRRWAGPDGEPVHHLIDPATGRPAATGLIAVTVAIPDPVWAEIWSKALFIAGADRIAGVADRRGLAAWWVRDDRRVGGSQRARPAERYRLRAA